MYIKGICNPYSVYTSHIPLRVGVASLFSTFRIVCFVKLEYIVKGTRYIITCTYLLRIHHVLMFYVFHVRTRERVDDIWFVLAFRTFDIPYSLNQFETDSGKTPPLGRILHLIEGSEYLVSYLWKDKAQSALTADKISFVFYEYSAFYFQNHISMIHINPRP